MVRESASDTLIAIIRGDVFQTARTHLVVGRLALAELNRRGVDVYL